MIHTPSVSELASILEAHHKWLRNEDGGQRADLSGAYLSRANLSGANLSWANLSGANLSWADLSGADLSGADLSGAKLSWAYLSWANLSGANLSWANLSGADLSGADLSGALNLTLALGYSLVCSQLSIIPDEGDVIGFKKCLGGVIVKLVIRNGVPRSNATGRKCRAQSAEVLEVIGAEEGRSKHDEGRTVYRVGETVTCHEWSSNRWEECAGGIHFFITKAEAEAY
jgi:hypothetical protein